MNYFIYYLLLINLAGFSLMGIDKWKAKSHRWRIPEKTLLLTAILGGSAGTYCAMQIFRHKTKHLHFSIGIPLILAVQILIAVIVYAKTGSV